MFPLKGPQVQSLVTELISCMPSDHTVKDLKRGFAGALSFPGGSDGKEFPAMRESWVCSLGREDLLEKGMATHSCILACRIPQTEESMGSQRVRHN